jgi:hypothetical protein
MRGVRKKQITWKTYEVRKKNCNIVNMEPGP